MWNGYGVCSILASSVLHVTTLTTGAFILLGDRLDEVAYIYKCIKFCFGKCVYSADRLLISVTYRYTALFSSIMERVAWGDVKRNMALVHCCHFFFVNYHIITFC